MIVLTVCCTEDYVYFTGRLLPLAYGIKKFQITCVIEDDKVSTEVLEEKITAFEDVVSCLSFTCLIV